ALILPLLALGGYNQRFAVPKLKGELASPFQQRRFLRMAGSELILFVAVLGVTAVLVREPPAKAALAAQPHPVTVDRGLGPSQVRVVADPATTGPNQIRLVVRPKPGRPGRLDESSARASLPSRHIPPLTLEAHNVSLGNYTVHNALLSVPGLWRLKVIV